MNNHNNIHCSFSQDNLENMRIEDTIFQNIMIYQQRKRNGEINVNTQQEIDEYMLGIIKLLGGIHE